MQAILCYGLWILILMPLNLYWYYWRKVRHLKNKDFFLTMFLLMQATLLSYFVLHSAELITGAESANVIFITYNLYYAGDSMLHTLFVMKYWGLSRKISYTISGVPDPNFECKYYTLLN